jgi:hypothetical protein
MRNPPVGYEPLHRDALIDQSKQQARRLRRQAVPDFWDGVDASCAKAARSLSRVLSRLARHHQSPEPMCADGSKVKVV